MNRIITFGTFVVFHIGHLRILECARALGDYLLVGVSKDKINFDKKDHSRGAAPPWLRISGNSASVYNHTGLDR